MALIIEHFGEIAAFLGWVGLWMIGGMWIAQGVFNLSKDEVWVVGLGIGLIIETWLANLFGQVMPVPAAFWAAAGVVFLLGLGLSQPVEKRLEGLKIPLPKLSTVIGFGVIVLMFTMIGRGLAIFDDYQNIPITSQLAVGDIPPHFSKDPNISFGYHYLLLLFSAQISRIGDLPVWTTLDIARGLMMGLALFYVSLFTRRLTNNKMAGALGAAFWVFYSGTRWLLLFLPENLIERVSESITMIGSGLTSGANLIEALGSYWEVDGGPALFFPFAFNSGLNQMGVMYHNGVGALPEVMILLVLLTHDRWKDNKAAWVTTAIMAAFGLVFELPVAFMALAWGLLLFQHRSERKELLIWFRMAVISGVIILFQGGVFTGVINGIITPDTGAAGAGYYDLAFPLAFPPMIISSHLGKLTLTNPFNLLAAVLEIGPTLLVIPLLIERNRNAQRKKDWFEASLLTAALLSMGSVFVIFTGNAGISATTRLYIFIWILKLYAFGLVWNWAAEKSDQIKTAAVSVGLASMVGGMMFFGIQFTVIPEPTLSYFLTDLDAYFYQIYWNELEENALIFDPNPSRPASVFGRLTVSGATWYTSYPEWDELRAAPDPYAIREAGYDYMYFGQEYLGEIEPEKTSLLEDDCMVLVDETILAGPYDFRRLYDIRGCE